MQQNIILTRPALLRQLLPQRHADGIRNRHPHAPRFGSGQIQRRKQMQIALDDMHAFPLPQDRSVHPPPKPVAAARARIRQPYGRAAENRRQACPPTVGIIQNHIVALGAHLAQQRIFLPQLIPDTLLLPIPIHRQNAADKRIIGNNVFHTLVHQHIDRAIGIGLFQSIGGGSGQQNITVVHKLDDQDGFRRHNRTGIG